MNRMMRYALITLLALVGLSAASADERILRFHSDITVNKDTSLLVKETIVVNAQGNRIKRGIFRDFPQLYSGEKFGLRRKRGFDVASVTQDGRPAKYVIESLSGGKRVRIGSEDVYLNSGIHEYVITYRTTRHLGYFDDYDELYWNVTGNGWEFQIDEASAEVTLPDGATVEKVVGYTGATGSTEQNVEATSTGSRASFITTLPLYSQEGLTIAVRFPKGHVDAAADSVGLVALVKDNLGICMAVLGFLALIIYQFLQWVRVGRDPKAGTIIPRYEPPLGFSPAAVRTLSRMGSDEKVFSAAIIGLAAKGMVQIEEVGKKEFNLKRLRTEPLGAENSLNADERALFDELMGGRNSLRLKQDNHEIISGGKDALESSLATWLERRYFFKNTAIWLVGVLVWLLPLAWAVFHESRESLGPCIMFGVGALFSSGVLSALITAWSTGVGRIKMTLVSIPFLIFMAIATVLFVKSAGPILAIVALGGAFASAVFYHLMKAPTRLGREALDEIEGFKRYLSVAEKDRLNAENPPERTPELFERFLPYALALDVEHEWSEQFASVLAAAASAADADGGHSRDYSPSFYSGTNFNGLTAGAMAGAIGSTLASNLASSSVSPSSSSGSGGGGFSGGGGGGGGGGGW